MAKKKENPVVEEAAAPAEAQAPKKTRKAKEAPAKA